MWTYLSQQMKKNCPVKVSSLKMTVGLHFLPWEVAKAQGMMICLKSSIFTFLMKFIIYASESLNYSFIHGQLPHSQSQTLITSVEKKCKDKRFLKNWRPVSLINSDSKIGSKCLALGIGNILSSLIHRDPTAYVKGKYIMESVRLISDILAYTDSKDIEALYFEQILRNPLIQLTTFFLFCVLEFFRFSVRVFAVGQNAIKNAERYSLFTILLKKFHL